MPGGKEPELRICRLPWNDNEWQSPSGNKGKSKGKAFEAYNGFALEEWLFRTRFQHDGYQYGYLQAFQTPKKAHRGKTFELIFYTIDGYSGARYWVSSLNDVEVLDEMQTEKILKVHQSIGWLQIQIEEAIESGHPTRTTRNAFKRGDFFSPNIRFPVEQLDQILPIELKVIPDFEKHISNHRYNLVKPLKKYLERQHKRGFNFNSGNSEPLDLARPSDTRRPPAKPIEPRLDHNKLMHHFHKYLKKKYPLQVVNREGQSNENRIDLVREDCDGNFIFYELKTYNSVRTSLRVALGQILEYALFPDKTYASKLIIVTHRPPDEQTKTYLKHLNTILIIPIGLIYFNMEASEIELEI